MSVEQITAAAKEAGISGEAALVAFTLGFGAGVAKPVLRESVGEMGALEEAQPNTLYVHPVSGNCVGAMCYIGDQKLGIQCSFMNIMEGKQMAPWYLALNPNHAVPTLCDDTGAGVWESGVILRKLASYTGEEINNTQAIAMDWRQTCMYAHCAKVYAPYLGFGGDDATIPEGVKGLQEKCEPILKSFLGDSKFIGGRDTPGIADYDIVPVLTMLPPYLAVADDRIKQYVADFKAASSSWATMGAQQTGYVASIVEKKPVEGYKA